MRKLSVAVGIIGTVFGMLAAQPVPAQADRTWVSGIGNDFGICIVANSLVFDLRTDIGPQKGEWAKAIFAAGRMTGLGTAMSPDAE